MNSLHCSTSSGLGLTQIMLVEVGTFGHQLEQPNGLVARRNNTTHPSDLRLDRLALTNKILDLSPLLADRSRKDFPPPAVPEGPAEREPGWA